jgi:hypothetical protein
VGANSTRVPSKSKKNAVSLRDRTAGGACIGLSCLSAAWSCKSVRILPRIPLFFGKVRLSATPAGASAHPSCKKPLENRAFRAGSGPAQRPPLCVKLPLNAGLAGPHMTRLNDLRYSPSHSDRSTREPQHREIPTSALATYRLKSSHRCLLCSPESLGNRCKRIRRRCTWFVVRVRRSVCNRNGS